MTRTPWATRALISGLVVGLLTILPGTARAAGRQAVAVAGPMSFGADGATKYGNWHADVTVSDTNWWPGGAARVYADLALPETVLTGLAGAGIVADQLCLLVTAERTFDQSGWMRLASEDTVSTLLTPAGLAIEGGVQGAVTNRYGYQYRSPVDVFVSMPLTGAPLANDTRRAAFNVAITFPGDLPPGLYRVRVDFGVMVGKRIYNLNGSTFTSRPFDTTRSYAYSPIVEASGPDAAGRYVDASQLQPRCPWLLLANYNSNGYRGVVADEDASRFAISARSLIADEVILPMYSDGGSRLSYSLEPSFPVDTIDAQQNLAWNWTSGELTVRITNPDGSVTDLGTSSFQGKAKYGIGPTTNWISLTTWKPPAYGRYTVVATGWIADGSGRRFAGGGTYRFWIAKRMTLATATFQGMPYPVGSSYGRDIQFNPAMPADVQVTATLFVNSDPNQARELTYCGKASPAGIFGAAQGMKPFPLDAPGEYHAKVLATYTDPGGHLWVSTMRHAGVVYPTNTQVVARGKKLSIGGKYVERGSTSREGYIEANGTQHLEHLTFPYQSGDVLLIASENQGANKVEPVLTYQMQGDTSAWDTKLNGVGTTNLRIKTSNGYSPHLYPEFITDIEYYYGAAPRPGFMGRFVVGESTSRAPYWPVSPNSFGGQIGASANGDAPGDIYRLLGGVVIRRVGQAPMYAGYIASAFLLPRGSNDNRVIAPGTEELHGPMGDAARFFLVGLRPGTSYEAGSTFRAGGQIDPILPVNVHFVLTYPDGRQQVADVVGDAYGAFAGPTAWTLDVPGVYRYQLSATWNGFPGGMPGLPESGGEFFVYSKTRPVSAAGLTIDGSPHRTFPASGTTTITGSSSAGSVHYTMVTPGAVIGQGELPVIAGKFSLVFDPAAVHAKVPLYDIVNNTTGAAQIGRVVHITFFSQENSAGQTFYDVTRVLLRGTTVLSARALLPDAVKPVLTVSRSGQGSITIPMGGTGAVECDSCSMPLQAGTTVTLAATPAPGSIFVGWTGACSGTGTCTVTVESATSVGATFAAGTIHRRYFAEGAATTFFDCVFALANPGEATAHVTMRFLEDGGPTVVHTLDVPAGSRRTVDAKLVPGLAPASGFSTIVESDVPVIADRTMSWDRGGYGSHAEVAVEAPAQTWYLAEGSTVHGFQLYYLVENPNDRATDVQITYLRPSPLPPIVRTHTLAALSRQTILVNAEAPELAAVDVSGIVASLDPASPIIVERAMYLDGPGQPFAAGTDSAGVTAPATDWFLAEGATTAPFDTYVLLANPGDSAASAEVTYMTGSGRTVTQVHQLAPKSRFTIWVNGVEDEIRPGEGLANEAVSTAVHADVPILVERAMWWPSGGTGWREAHASAGAREAGTAWAMAGGEQGGPRNVQTYVLLTNTSAFDGRVRMTLLPESGNPVVQEIDVPASARTTVWMGGTTSTATTPFGGVTNGTRFGLLVESEPGASGTARIVVERAMYSDASGETWAAGTGVVATRLR